MVEINDQNHTSSLISSIDKIYKKSRLSGFFDVEDIHLLNMVYKLLNNCCIELNIKDRMFLNELYRNIYFSSDNICESSYIQPYEINPIVKFEQADSSDCNSFDPYPKIYYWQEEDYNTVSSDIEPLLDDQNYFLNKQYDSKENFEIGKNILYSNIGRVCFAVTDCKETDTYRIYDSLNNDVTHTFDRAYIDNLNIILFVSDNFYSNGYMFFKIKKTSEVTYTRIFNEMFNDKFK